MRVLIVGSGINGSLVGATLVEAGVDVTFLTRASRQRQLMTTGLQIASPLGRFRKPVHAIAPPKRIGDALDVHGPFDVIVIATRSNFYQSALFTIRDIITPEALIAPLLDGAHHLTHWRECYPNNIVALARCDVRAMMDADGIVRQFGPQGSLNLGLLSPTGAERLEALCVALDGRRLRTVPNAETVLADVWARAIFRAAAAGASKLAGMPLRDTVRFKSKRPYIAMLDEGIRAAELKGVRRVREAVGRYRDGFMREGEPIQAPVPIEAGGRAGSEALFLLGNMLRQVMDAKIQAPYLRRAWETDLAGAAPTEAAASGL